MSTLQDPVRVLALYDAQMRAEPPPEPGVSRIRSGGVLRTTGDHHCIGYARLCEQHADAAIAEEVAFFRALGAPVEWKLYGHDRPADLGHRLARAGFRAEETEHLMVLDLDANRLDDTLPDGIAIREVRDSAGLRDYVLASGAAFGRDEARAYRTYGARLADPSLVLHVAYDGHLPVAAARLELPPARSFAGLWGGGTIASHRGRGIYRAMVAVRAWEALWRGYRYLTVDARDTSRPILERLGFVALTQVTGWVLEV